MREPPTTLYCAPRTNRPRKAPVPATVEARLEVVQNRAQAAIREQAEREEARKMEEYLKKVEDPADRMIRLANEMREMSAKVEQQKELVMKQMAQNMPIPSRQKSKKPQKVDLNEITLTSSQTPRSQETMQ